MLCRLAACEQSLGEQILRGWECTRRRGWRKEAINFSSSTVLPGAGSGGKTGALTSVRERTDSNKCKMWRSEKVEENDPGKRGAGDPIVNLLDLEIKR